MRLLFFLLLLLLPSAAILAQIRTGIVKDANGPLANVTVSNIYTNEVVITDRTGDFKIMASPGQLLEFRKVGYEVARFRTSAGNVPFYSIQLTPGYQQLDEIEIRSKYNDFYHDSLRYHDYFKKQLNYPVVTGWRAIQSPFSAMSKTNQQMIAFQKEYKWLEQMKYVDYNFNEKVITNVSGLKGDSAIAYMQAFRPSYEQIRGMKEYEVLSYIRHTAEIWRKKMRSRTSTSRSGG